MIKLENVSKVYRSGKNVFEALQNINLEITEGEFVAIMGPSGSGKSTLMNIIGLLDTKFKGQYKLNGQEVKNFNDNQVSAYRNGNIGFVFQNFNLLPKLNAYRNIEMPLIYSGKLRKGEMKKRVLEGLENMDLLAHKKHLPKELSGGQKQRIAIARALVTNPSFILADEPTGALDSKTGDKIMDIFTELHKSGKTIILITHDRKIANYADRLVTILDGKIVSDEVLR